MTYPIYYILTSEKYKIEQTDSIDDLILKLADGTAEFISGVQRSELKLPKDYLSNLKIRISSNKSRVPLYDIRFNHIYLIYWKNVYKRIFYDNYRFIDENFYQDLVKLRDPTSTDKENLRILSHYDLDQLKQTYLEIFYDSFVLDHYITSCKRPSFSSQMEHIRPYYDISELYYLALDWNVIKGAKLKDFKEEDLRKICQTISQYDIPSKILLDHQIYIFESKAIGLVKNYSLFGSYFINDYLRKYGCYIFEQKDCPSHQLIKNTILENQIKLMIELISKAPKFTQSHVVYRFVESDHYIHHLKPGDTYIDPSFMSTTRDPYGYQENYNFGYILLKIKIPANKIGIGLCIESYSNFPSEEEIILPPTSAYELISVRDEPDEHSHIADKKLSLNKIIRKYEFELKTNNFMGNNKVQIYGLPLETEPEIPVVDLDELLKDETIKFTPVASRLKYFSKSYVNSNSQFQSLINGINIGFNLHSYNSTTVYKKFFYLETESGLLMYSFNPNHGNINLMIELGPEMHINYYFKYSVSDLSFLLKLDDKKWIHWLCLLAYVLGSKNIIIHSNYSIGSKSDPTLTRYANSSDLYDYLSKKKRRFEGFGNDILTPNFNYAQLDYLHLVGLVNDNPLETILKSTDRDELYKLAMDSKIKTAGEFYLYVADSNPGLLGLLETKLNAFYELKGLDIRLPDSISYTLNPWAYLLNNGLVSTRPKDSEFNIRPGAYKSLIGDKKIPQFRNRLRYYLENK
jgi:hypothetical protein